MHDNIVSSKSMNLMFQLLNFAIKKGLMTQLVICLSFVPIYIYLMQYL
jgi:hypothetical protein